jgi:glutaconate CoA-transferase subunit B
VPKPKPALVSIVGLLAGGTFRVVTDLAVFGFDADKRRMQVMSLNPGVTREELQDNTGFALDFSPHPGVTEPPTDQELELLRELDPDRLYTG